MAGSSQYGAAQCMSLLSAGRRVQILLDDPRLDPLVGAPLYRGEAVVVLVNRGRQRDEPLAEANGGCKQTRAESFLGRIANPSYGKSAPAGCPKSLNHLSGVTVYPQPVCARGRRSPIRSPGKASARMTTYRTADSGVPLIDSRSLLKTVN
jgi:hypothetical protein